MSHSSVLKINVSIKIWLKDTQPNFSWGNECRGELEVLFVIDILYCDDREHTVCCIVLYNPSGFWLILTRFSYTKSQGNMTFGKQRSAQLHYRKIALIKVEAKLEWL